MSKTVIFLGSSVTYGSATGGVSFADLFCEKNNVNMVKEAVSGTTLVDDETEKESYIERLKTIKVKDADLFICQLSTNDATKNKPLGKVAAGKDIFSFDTDTVAGAIEYVIAYAINKWDCPVMFYTNPVYGSKEYEAMVVLLAEIAAKWDISIIDLWNDEAFNNIGKDNSAKYMADPIHPTLEGYREWWLPYFEEKIRKVIEY